MSKMQCLIWIGIAAAAASLQAQKPRTLRDAYKQDFYIGTALNSDQIAGRDKSGDTLILQQFNALSPENILKWEVVHPMPNRYDFTLADQYVAFGQQNGMFVLGHTLVWHSQTPGWVFEDDHGAPISRDALLQRLHDHIFTVVGRYKGRIRSWDVVNEALNDDGTLRNSKWLQIIGPDYLTYAYKWAQEADPAAELNYNDYSLENPAKLKGAMQIVRTLQKNGVKIAVVGVQGHDSLTWPTLEAEEKVITELASLGVKVAISELDINVLPEAQLSTTADVSYHLAADPTLDPYVKGLPKGKQEELACRYADLFKIYLKHKDAMSRVTFWGLRDGDSWLNDWPVKGRTNYPLLFDRAGKPKAAFQAVLDAARSQ